MVQVAVSARILSHRIHLLISYRKSTPSQDRQLIAHSDSLKYSVVSFVRELTFLNQPIPAWCGSEDSGLEFFVSGVLPPRRV